MVDNTMILKKEETFAIADVFSFCLQFFNRYWNKVRVNSNYLTASFAASKDETLFPPKGIL